MYKLSDVRTYIPQCIIVKKKKVTYGMVEEEKEYFCTSLKYVESVSDIVPVVP